MNKKEERKKEKIRIRHENFVKRMSGTFGDEYTVLGMFFNVGTKILMKHNLCGYEWSPLPSNFVAGKSKCPRCSGREALTTDTFKQKVEGMKDGEYEVVGEYTNAKAKVSMKHKLCGYQWDVKPKDFIVEGYFCPRCQNRERYTTEEVNNKVKELTDCEYDLVGEYINNYTPIILRHIACDSTFETSLTNFTQGERKIGEYLDSFGIEYIREHYFDDCRNINPLPFDVAVAENGNIEALIEFDGKQHFEPIDFFGGREAYESTKIRDEIKNKYCTTNKIPLLRIPYYDEELIDSILYDFLVSLNILQRQRK